MTWSFDLPVELKVAIADAVTIFSRIDHSVIQCIWLLAAAGCSFRGLTLTHDALQLMVRHFHAHPRRTPNRVVDECALVS
jgi:hypothetical protein